jgi:SCP-2 sterol transfer family protein
VERRSELSTTEKASDPESAPEFFGRLTAEEQPLLAGAEGTLRFDVIRGDTTTTWYVRIDHGDVKVSHDTRAADAMVRVNEPLFDDFVGGRANAVAAALRGEMSLQGSPQLLTVFQRLFPGPPRRSAS